MSDRREPVQAGRTPLEILERMVRRVREREAHKYFVGLLDFYARQQRLTETQVAAFVGVEAGRPWTRLALCGRPRPQRLLFWPDIKDIAEESGANPDRLVSLVRVADTFLALQDLSRHPHGAENGGLLAAARDRLRIDNSPATSANSGSPTDEIPSTLPFWLDAGTQRAVAHFWEAAGATEPEPSYLERDALRSLPCVSAYLPRLTLSRIEDWLAAHYFPYRFPCGDRPLRGCLLAYRGCGLIFIDAEDSPEQQRYTLAHEIVHLILDYLQPRDEAVARLGPAVTDVLDGRREATHGEQVEAVFEQISLQSYFHLMDRAGATTRGMAIGTTRAQMSNPVKTAEDVADRVALELLAPSRKVMARLIELGVDNLSNDLSRFVSATCAVLHDEYRLPPGPAQAYACTLTNAFKAPTFEGWLTDL